MEVLDVVHYELDRSFYLFLKVRYLVLELGNLFLLVQSFDVPEANEIQFVSVNWNIFEFNTEDTDRKHNLGMVDRMIANFSVLLRIIDVRQELVDLQFPVIIEKLFQEGVEAHFKQLVTKLGLLKSIDFADITRATKLDRLLLRTHNLLVLGQIRLSFSLN